MISTSGFTQSEWPVSTGTYLNVASRPGEGAPVVLLHGVMGSWRQWLPIVASEPDPFCGHPLLAVDLRGHGMSGRPETDYTIDEMASDLISVITSQPARQVILGGYSLGALVALRVYERAPDLVEALMLVEPPLPGANQGVETDLFYERLFELAPWLAALRNQPAAVIEASMREIQPDLPPDLVTIDSEDLANTAEGVFHGFLMDPDRRAPRPEPVSHPSSTPTLVIQGGIADGRALSDVGIADLEERFPAMTLVVIPDAAHGPMHQNTAATSAAIREFMTGLG